MSTSMRRQSPNSGKENPEPLGALLDHLGRLLAEEYVAILMSNDPPESDYEEVR